MEDHLFEYIFFGKEKKSIDISTRTHNNKKYLVNIKSSIIKINFFSKV